MQHFFVDASQVSEETIRIEGSDVNHMKNVLRMRIGESFGMYVKYIFTELRFHGIADSVYCNFFRRHI